MKESCVTRECAPTRRALLPSGSKQGKASLTPVLPAEATAGARPTTGFAAILAADADSVDDHGRALPKPRKRAIKFNDRYARVQADLTTVHKIVKAFKAGIIKRSDILTNERLSTLVGYHEGSGIDTEALQMDLAIVRAPFRLVTVRAATGNLSHQVRMRQPLNPSTPQSC